MPLTLSRRVGESLEIGDDITITVSQIAGKQTKLSIDAPKKIPIYRSELLVKRRVEPIYNR